MQANPALKEEILALERRYWDAVRDKDAQTATSLTDDSCTVVGAQGVHTVTREALAQMMEHPSCELRRFSLDDMHVEQISDDVVSVAYKVSEELTVDGEVITMQACDSSVWTRRDGQWRCVLHTETPQGDPYGRRH